MSHPYLIMIWQGSLIDAAKFISERSLGDQIVQFIEAENPRGYWCAFRVTGDQDALLRDVGARARPRWSILP